MFELGSGGLWPRAGDPVESSAKVGVRQGTKALTENADARRNAAGALLVSGAR